MIALVQKQRGLTLIELMIAITLGLLLSAAITSIFLQTKKSGQQSDNLARMQENARFAIQLLSQDLLHADFFADVDAISEIVNSDPPAPTQDCDDSAGNDWLYELAADKRLYYLPNQSAADAHDAYDCIAAADFLPGTNIFAIQRLMGDRSTAPGAFDDNVYMRSNGALAEVFHYNDSAKPDIKNAGGTDGSDWVYLAHVYYIDNDRVFNREYMQAGATPTMVQEPLVDNIEYFHIEFGIDDTVEDDLDGVPNYYTATPGDDIQYAVAAHIYVLARSPQQETGYTNSKSYKMGSVTKSAYNDGYYRRVYTSTVVLKNLRNRLQLGEQ